MPEVNTKDFIASELLGELKAENQRKDRQIRGLYYLLAASFAAMLLIVGGFLWYLNQYDFSSTTSEYTTQSVNGVYAVVDSEGNVVGQDLTPEEIQHLMEVLANGTSESINP